MSQTTVDMRADDDAEPSEGSLSSGSAAVAGTERGPHHPIIRLNHRVSGWVLSALGELVALLLGLGFLWFGTLALLIIRGGADLTVLVPNAQMWFAEAYDGQEASIGALRVDVDSAEAVLRLSGRDIVVRDQTGVPINELSRLETRFDLNDALQGRADLLGLVADGGALGVRRDRGGWVAGLGTADNLGKLGPLVSLDGQSAPQTTTPPILISSATLYVSDRVDDLDVELRNADINLEGGARLTGSLRGLLSREDEAVPLELSVRPDGETDLYALSVEGLRPSRFASERGRLAELSKLDLPITGNLTLNMIGNEPQRVEADIQTEAGTVQIGPESIDIREADMEIKGSRTGAVEMEIRQFDSDRLKTSGNANFEVTRDEQAIERITGDVRLSNTLIDTKSSLGRLSVATPRTRFDWNLRQRRLGFSQLDVGLAEVRFSGDLGMGFGQSGLDRLDLDLTMTGDLSPEGLLSLWPENVVSGARRWIDRAILEGNIFNLTIVGQLGEAAFTGAPIPDEDLTLEFDVRDGRVKYISTMTPMENASGQGVLKGNSLNFRLDQGRVGTVNINGATIAMPRINPKGGPLTIRAKGEGQAEALLTLINEPPFNFATRYNIDPETFSGQGNVDLTITRPLREFITLDQVSYAVEGMFRDVSVPFELAGERLTNGQITLKADATRLELAGPVEFGPWQADMTYLDTLGDDGSTPTRASLSGVLSRDALDAFGIGLRQFLDGDIPVQVDAITDGLNLLSADIEADLTGTVLSLDPYWAKPFGIDSDLSATLFRQDGQSVFRNVGITAPGMTLRGEVALNDNGSLESLAVETLSIEDVADLGVRLRPNDERTALIAEANGRYLDLSPVVSERLRMGAGQDGLPLRLTAGFDTLRLAPDYDVINADLSLISDVGGISAFSLLGEVEEAPVTVRLEPSVTGRALSIDLPDASVAASALFGFTGTEGGALQLSADLPAAGEPGAIFGEIGVQDMTLTRAPILAQILSIASLEGLGNTLSGQGLDFENIDGEFAFREGLLSMRKFRANGAALGLTVEGEVQLRERELDINGVLVPAYTTNSLLGDIPLIGDLLVGKEGEGILSLNYSVAGPYERAEVAVNPLSALTPGVLREIFRPQRDDLEEVMEQEIERSDEPQ